jgi:glucarate dehydratase
VADVEPGRMGVVFVRRMPDRASRSPPLAAAMPNPKYACEAHWPWKAVGDDVVSGTPFTFNGGSLAVLTGTGLGVELDWDALARLHEQYIACGLRNRDDTGNTRSIVPDYERKVPR